jgi:hypothetical protein
VLSPREGAGIDYRYEESLNNIANGMLAGEPQALRSIASMAHCSTFLVDAERSETAIVDMPGDWGRTSPIKSQCRRRKLKCGECNTKIRSKIGNRLAHGCDAPSVPAHGRPAAVSLSFTIHDTPVEAPHAAADSRIVASGSQDSGSATHRGVAESRNGKAGDCMRPSYQRRCSAQMTFAHYGIPHARRRGAC